MQFISDFLASLVGYLGQVSAVFALVLGYFIARWQFRFQSLHQRRLVVIEEAYEKLKLAEQSFKSLTNPVQETVDMSEKEKDFVVKANDMSQYLNKRRLFFSTEEQSEIDIITDKFSKIWGDYRFKKIIQDDPGMLKKRTELYVSIWDSTSKEIPELITSLEKVFKKALGLK